MSTGITEPLTGSPTPGGPPPAPEPPEAPPTPEQGAEERPQGLFAKLAKIMGELSAIPAEKLRHVEVSTRSGGTYSYDYITEATLMEELRPKLAREGIATLYSDEIIRNPAAGEDGDNLTVVQVRLTFVDGPTGERWTSTAEGYGTDAGDKGANKAKTSALRYLLWKTFLFASDVDPEEENVERQRQTGGRRGSAGTGRPASDKQQKFVVTLLNDLDEKGVIDDAGRRPQDAVHVRRAVPDLTGEQASKLIEEMKAMNKADAVDPANVTVALDAILGPPSVAAGDFPPDDEGTEPIPTEEGY
jgi:ERF superfamily protein